MPSLLSCFCVHHRRQAFSTRKRNSRKKILNRNSDWISDTNSDIYHRYLQEDCGYHQTSPDNAPKVSENTDGEILSRLLDSQASPRRRHVQDIFREEPPVIEPLPQLHSLYSSVPSHSVDSSSSAPSHSLYSSAASHSLYSSAPSHSLYSSAPSHSLYNSAPSHSLYSPVPSHSVDRMNGYVPRAVGQISASSLLTGGKMDDFFSDCRLHPALDKFANSTEFNHATSDFYTIDRNDKRPSIVRVGTSEKLNSSNLHIEIEDESSQVDDVMRGSVSSDCVSPAPSEDGSITSERVHGRIIYPETSMSSLHGDGSELSLDKMFHSDGDVLY